MTENSADIGETNPRFANRLAFWFGGLFIAAVFLVIRVWYAGLPIVELPGMRQQRLELATRLLRVGADNHAARISATLRERRGDVIVLAENRVLAAELDQKNELALHADFQRVVERLHRAYPDDYAGILLASPDGSRIRASSEEQLQVDRQVIRSLSERTTQPGVVELMEQIETSYGPLVAINRVVTKPDRSGEPNGVRIGVLVALLALQPLMELSGESVGPGHHYVVIDSDGRTLFSSAADGKTLMPSAKLPPGFEGVLSQVLPNGEPGVVAYRYLQLNGSQGWTVAHYVSEAQALEGLDRLLSLTLTAGFALALLGIAMIMVVARRVTAPLHQLARIAERFGEGQLGERAAQNRQMPREVALLSSAFNSMAEHIEATQRSLEATVVMRTAEAIAARDQLQATLDALPDLLFDVDESGRIYQYHANSRDLLAASPSVFLNKTFADVLPAAAAEACGVAIHEAAEQGYSTGVQYSLMLADGEHWFEASVATKPVMPGESLRFVFVARDITERKRQEEEIRRMAFFDVLTGLANRRLMLDRLEQARTASARNGHFNGLLLIDLDHFKDLNDTLGHEIGDQLLVEASRRFVVSVREADTVSRLGGDEFVIILRDFSTDANVAGLEIERIAEKIRKEIARPFALRVDDGTSRDYQISLSIGISLFNGVEDSVEELMKRADTAMYQAKRNGRNGYCFYDASMQAVVQARTSLEESLREAVARGQFVEYYQPVLSADGHCLGAEVLVRWQHPERGLVLPSEFIAAMELNGLILPLGHWILQQACATLKRWQGAPVFSDLSLAINVSARQVAQANFVADTLTLLGAAHVMPQRLKMELTESLLIHNTEDVISKMLALKAAGVHFALDDFGTGYSSLSYLKRLPLDLLKIDRSFVRDIFSDTNDLEIARLILGLGKTMELSVLAEGIESDAQLDLLRGMGCQAFQGYLFGKPMPLAEFEAWLHAQHRST